MKVLYGVQGTGNGHTSRARAMARAFADTSLQVDYLFTGRDPDRYFNMEPFGNYRCLPGMTLFTRHGRMQMLKTAFGNRPLRLLSDIRRLDLSSYDLVITDFEPVSAWAARLRGTPSVGLAHQYAFLHPVPRASGNLPSHLLMNWFAPAQIPLGLHWHHFDAPILPPLIEDPRRTTEVIPGKILVYLPFEDPDKVRQWLTDAGYSDFFIYQDTPQARDMGQLHFRPFSREHFLADFLSAEGVIANAGFMLSSEAIHYGKKLLVKPVTGQMEQESNVAALEQLGYGQALNNLDRDALQHWLHQDGAGPHPFPDAAVHIARWIEDGMSMSPQQLAKQIWTGQALSDG